MVKYWHMNKNIYIGILTGLALGATVTSPSFAAVSCYGPLDQDPKALGEILPCFLEQIWSFFQMIFVAAALIMGMFLVYKTFTNRENPKVLEELPIKWGYLVIFTLLAFGAGGTILN